jgi:hypothetical protein
MTQQANRMDLTALFRLLPASSGIFRPYETLTFLASSGLFRPYETLTFPASSGLTRLSLFRHLPASSGLTRLSLSRHLPASSGLARLSRSSWLISRNSYKSGLVHRRRRIQFAVDVIHTKQHFLTVFEKHFQNRLMLHWS